MVIGEFVVSYDKDKPIVVCSEDLLDRQCFSQEFGKALYEYNGADGLVVGLYGKWGSGKTSVLNMAKEEIKRLIKEKEKKVISNSFKEFLSKLFQFMHKHNKTEIIEFSPWNYSDKNNLISLFFQSLKYKLCRKNSSSIGKNIKKALKKYIYAIRALEIVPTVGPALAPVLKTIVKVLQSPDLNEAKRKLSAVSYTHLTLPTKRIV